MVLSSVSTVGRWRVTVEVFFAWIVGKSIICVTASLSGWGGDVARRDCNDGRIGRPTVIQTSGWTWRSHML